MVNKETKNMNNQVAILMGSKSDLPKIQSAIDTLNTLQVKHTVRIMSAHRTPNIVMEFAENAEKNGIKVIICAAGMAAHLAGVVAAHTTLPVIGIPVEGGPFKGMDALLATVQMPGGIPVATVGVGSGGAKNAALLATQIIALSDKQLATRFKQLRQENSQKVIATDQQLQTELK